MEKERKEIKKIKVKENLKLNVHIKKLLEVSKKIYKKHKNISSKNKDQLVVNQKLTDLITYDICNIYKDLIKNKDLFQIKNEIFEYQFYEKEFFENIPIIRDGNCLYRTNSYYFNNNQYQYSQLRQTTYNYVKSNITRK